MSGGPALLVATSLGGMRGEFCLEACGAFFSQSKSLPAATQVVGVGFPSPLDWAAVGGVAGVRAWD